MAGYEFLTTWLLDAPREDVWDAIWESEEWPSWWRGVVEATEIDPGTPCGVGRRGRYLWRSRIPYPIRFEIVSTVVEPPELRVVVLDVARREVLDPLHLDVVDHRREDLLARAVPVADRDPDHLAAVVLARLVPEPDRRGLPSPFELIDEDRRIEVEDVERAHPSGAYSAGFRGGDPRRRPDQKM
jgi:hypothetical protein